MLMPQVYSPSSTASGNAATLHTGEQRPDERLATREIRLIYIQHLPSSSFALHAGATRRRCTWTQQPRRRHATPRLMCLCTGSRKSTTTSFGTKPLESLNVCHTVSQ